MSIRVHCVAHLSQCRTITELKTVRQFSHRDFPKFHPFMSVIYDRVLTLNVTLCYDYTLPLSQSHEAAHS